MKKSGLADSPFFTLSNREEVMQTPPSLPQPVYERPPVQPNERTDTRTNTSSPVQSTARTNERPNDITPERLPERTPVPSSAPKSRAYHRYTYDIFDDQAEAIDDLTFRWRKEKGKHVTKGFVMRTLLDEALKDQK